MSQYFVGAVRQDEEERKANLAGQVPDTGKAGYEKPVAGAHVRHPVLRILAANVVYVAGKHGTAPENELSDRT